MFNRSEPLCVQSAALLNESVARGELSNSAMGQNRHLRYLPTTERRRTCLVLVDAIRSVSSCMLVFVLFEFESEERLATHCYVVR